MDTKLMLGRGQEGSLGLDWSKLNRHGFICGASGTGKTSSLRLLAEGLSAQGIPVFLSDVKGDISGLAAPGVESESVRAQLQRCGRGPEEQNYRGYPCRFWDIYGEQGIALRTSVSEFGPVLLAAVLELNEVQSSILDIAFRLADERKLLIVDLKDLAAILRLMTEERQALERVYGHLSSASIAAVLRAVLRLEAAGGETFFGEPAFAIEDLFNQAPDGRGLIHILEARRLMAQPRIYMAFMLWFLSELFETLPECGDQPRPKLVFFLDEAHLLFSQLSGELLSRLGQIVRLVRSKGLGLFFVTQHPADIAPEILAQLGNKIQHGLLAYTPAEQRRLQAVAQGLRPNPNFDTLEALASLGRGEALVSVLQEDGSPGLCQRLWIYPPESSFSPLDAAEQQRLIQSDPRYPYYAQRIDSKSAYECLLEESELRAEEERRQAEEREQAALEQKELKAQAREEERLRRDEERRREREERAAARRRSSAQDLTSRVARSAVNAFVSQLGRSIARGIFGSFKR